MKTFREMFSENSNVHWPNSVSYSFPVFQSLYCLQIGPTLVMDCGILLKKKNFLQFQFDLVFLSFNRHDLDLNVVDTEPETDSEEEEDDDDDDESLIDLDQFDLDEELLVDENQPLRTRETRDNDTDDDNTRGRNQIQVLVDINHGDQSEEDVPLLT